MPRYHFTLDDGATYLDPDGMDLPGLEEARNEAVTYAAEWLRDHPKEVWKDGRLQVTVTDEASKDLFTVTVSTADVPAEAG